MQQMIKRVFVVKTFLTYANLTSIVYQSEMHQEPKRLVFNFTLAKKGSFLGHDEGSIVKQYLVTVVLLNWYEEALFNSN